MMKWWWKLWWNYDEIEVKTASKCLARMTGCWDPEFEPSIEEIVDSMIYGDSLSLLSLASSHSRGISLFSLACTWQWRSRSGQPAQAVRPNIRVYRACAVCRCILVRIMAAYIILFMRDLGCTCSLSCSLHPEVPINKKEFSQAMRQWWRKLWWKYDENVVKTASKCSARMKACWGPEFEPSIEEIVDYRRDMAILSIRFLWQVHTRGNFPIQSQVEVTSGYGQPAQAVRPNIHVRVYSTEHAQFVDMS